MSDGAVSLYFKLKDGEKADLEVVATALLQWLDGARAAAREIDPNAQIRIEIVDADEASLSINGILEWVEGQLKRVEKGGSKYPRVRKLAIALALFVGTTAAQTYISAYFGPQPEVSLKASDRELLEREHKLLQQLLDQINKNPEIEVKRQKFFKTLQRDPSITAAGVKENPKTEPIVLVPSSQFAEKAGLWKVQDDEPTEREIYPVVDVTLVAPTLLPEPRSWKFQPDDGLPAFSATMRDKKFLAALAEQQVKEQLRIGIRMTLRLRVKEKRLGDVWVVKPRGRFVAEVISPKIG